MSIKSVIESKNGVELCAIILNGKTLNWELWVDGEYFNRFYNLKTAKQMYKDFASAV